MWSRSYRKENDTRRRWSTVPSYSEVYNVLISTNRGPACECSVRTFLSRSMIGERARWELRVYCEAESLLLTNAELYRKATATKQIQRD